MQKSLQLKKDLYWTGALDPELRVFDIIMSTEFGTTYNSYVLKGSEKTAVFETSKWKCFDQYLENLQGVVSVKDIDYVIMNHTEPDHAGSIAKLVELNPSIRVVGTAFAINLLKNIINHDFYSIAVKENDTLSLGNKTLRFMILPNLHWPDTMYTYVEEDKVLFTCDSFGSHYSFDGILLSKVTDHEGYMRATKYYFDNIIGPFKTPHMLKALKRIDSLDIQMICTGHGPVIDCDIDKVKETYRQWCTVVNPNKKKTVVIPYVSAYGYTKELAENISKGIEDSGDVAVKSYDMVEADPTKVLEEIGYADGILLGSPTILSEALKPIWDLTTSMFSVTHGGKLASAFGSYGWSGEAVPHLIERLRQLRMKVVDGYRVKLKPSENELVGAYEFGYDFGCILQNKENDKKKSAKRGLVKCLVCGEIFPEGTEVCPVCGVGKENFVPVEEQEITFHTETKENFVILGNGVAALSAAKAIRKRNQTCSITMISKEKFATYNRPMLTKGLLAHFSPEQMMVEQEQWYQENNITLMLGQEIDKVDTNTKEVYLSNGNKVKYDKCIYALGAHCFVPPISGTNLPEVITIRTIPDNQKICELLPNVKNAVVIGGGVLGLETAWELKKVKCNVTVLEAADKLMGRQLDRQAGKILEEIASQKGIQIRLNVKATAIQGDGHVTGVALENGEVIPADIVIISSGIRANTTIAKEAGITVERAIVVNNRMETNIQDVYACGDCAEFEGINYALWSEATEMGDTAGANAVGDDKLYQLLPAPLTFHGMDTAIYALGDNGSQEGVPYQTAEFQDARKKTYEKYYFINNRLCGVILLGDTSKMAKVTEAVEKHSLFKDLF